MAQRSFSATVSEWVAKTKQRQEAVYKGSAQTIVSYMQTTRAAGGNLRVDTGFLRASLVATTGAIPAVTFKPEGIDQFYYDSGPINLVISGAAITDPIIVAYTANYARAREYGARGQPGDRWVGLAAQLWVGVVQAECAKAQASVASRGG